jgi:pimeloyl-ACP methyl ester carboxylesterase
VITLSSLAARPLATLVSRPRPTTPTAPLADPATFGPRDPHARPWPGRELTAGGVTLYVRETQGASDAEAVYVHGLSGSGTNWTDLAGLLAPRATGLAVDLPGFGFTRPPAAPDYTPGGHADALLCFLAGRGRPVHLLGNSLGGSIAMMVAVRRPELVRSLTLVSPAMPDRRPDPRRVSDPRLILSALPGPAGRRAREGLAAMTNRDRIESVVRLCFGDPTLAPEHRLAEAVAEMDARSRQPWAYEAFDRTAKAMLRSWWRGESLWAVAARVRVPTLVVWGDRDRLVAPRLAARTTRVVGGRLLMLAGVGHVAQIEAPEAVAAGVAGLWDAVDRGRWESRWEDGG